MRWAAAAAARKARDLGVRSFSSIVHGAGAGGLNLAAAAQAVVEGTLLGLYRYQELKSKPPDRADPERLTLVSFDVANVPRSKVERGPGEQVAEAVRLARDLVNRPGNYATPATWPRRRWKSPVSLKRCDARCSPRRMRPTCRWGRSLGLPRAVTSRRHSSSWSTIRAGTDLDTVVLVGKGITFDSGGISLKSADEMDRMRGDMAGGAAVLATMQAVGDMDLPLHVVGLAPFTENLPGGRAYKPGDVLTAMNGKTIEILSTDAEGRLVLADALVYAARFAPKAVVDIATLTGACVIALGRGVAAGAFGNDDALSARLQAASAATGERIWPLPLYDDYLDKIESVSADLANSGGRQSGVGSSAIFLKQFVEGYPWVHLDIAGMSFEERADSPKRPPYLQKGGTGFGVRLLVQFLRDWVAPTQ